MYGRLYFKGFELYHLLILDCDVFKHNRRNLFNFQETFFTYFAIISHHQNIRKKDSDGDGWLPRQIKKNIIRTIQIR